MRVERPNGTTVGRVDMWKGIIRHYPEFYHFANQDHVITMLEGNTPLIPAPRLAEKINPDISLYLKYEGLNPSCSFSASASCAQDC